MRIGLIGANGRLGKRIGALASQDPDFEALLSITSATSIEERLEIAKASDLLIDVSTPSALKMNLNTALEADKPLIIGTTGFATEERKLFQAAADKLPLLYAPNFSLGIALLLPLVEQLSTQLGDRFALSIRETHHTEKRDAPSGTALALADASKRSPPITSLREGEVPGEHELLFSTPYEEIAIIHRAHSRDLFAEGALAAARRLAGKPPGLYALTDLFSS